MNTEVLNWVLPTARTDGTPLDPSEIASVDVFDAVNGATAVQIGVAPSGALTTFTTATLVPGTHVFTVVVVDTDGHPSVPSSPVSVTIPAPVKAAPNPATDLTATLVP